LLRPTIAIGRKKMSAEVKVKMEIFKAFVRCIAESDNLEIMSNCLAQALVSALDIKGCAIFYLNPEAGEFEVLATFGLSSTYLTKGPVLADRSIAAGLRGKAVIVPDVSKSSTVQYPEQARIEGISAIASVPIAFSKEVIGVLRLYHHEVWDLSKEDMDSLELLGASMGLAMAHTRLLNAVRSISELAKSALPERVLS
jgi:signal transduction protein with GAF and PtsI domain